MTHKDIGEPDRVGSVDDDKAPNMVVLAAGQLYEADQLPKRGTSASPDSQNMVYPTESRYAWSLPFDTVQIQDALDGGGQSDTRGHRQLAPLDLTTIVKRMPKVYEGAQMPPHSHLLKKIVVWCGLFPVLVCTDFQSGPFRRDSTPLDHELFTRQWRYLPKRPKLNWKGTRYEHLWRVYDTRMEGSIAYEHPDNESG